MDEIGIDLGLCTFERGVALVVVSYDGWGVGRAGEWVYRVLNIATRYRKIGIFGYIIVHDWVYLGIYY